MHTSVPGQLLQGAPPLPQALVAVPGWQAPLPSQQPLAQLVASHIIVLHAWPMQLWLEAQVAQVVPEQQPPGQFVELQELHMPLTHATMLGHIAQAVPALPQALAVSPGKHMLL